MLDTLTLSKRLKAVGFSDEQADALVEIQANVVADHLATKADVQVLRADLRDLETHMRASVDTLEARVDGKFLSLQWMLGLVLGGIVALILKAFF